MSATPENSGGERAVAAAAAAAMQRERETNTIEGPPLPRAQRDGTISRKRQRENAEANEREKGGSRGVRCNAHLLILRCQGLAHSLSKAHAPSLFTHTHTCAQRDSMCVYAHMRECVYVRDMCIERRRVRMLGYVYMYIRV